MAYNNPNKRKHGDRDTDSETEQDRTWPRFLVIEGTDSNIPLKKLSPFAIAKGIKGIAWEPKSIQNVFNGLLVEVAKKAHSDSLLEATKIANVPIKVTAHRSLNTRKGVIRCRELAGMDEEDIRHELADQNVVNVKRIFIDRGTRATNTYILTFGTAHLPTSIKAGYMNIKVNAYIPNPLRCFKCQRYGHGSNRCNREERCSKCAENHSVDACTATTLCCANCTENNEHAASDRKCPTYIKEQLVQKIKHTDNISFPEARKKVESATSLSTSYSTVVKSATKLSVASISTQTDLTWPRNQNLPSKVIPQTTNVTEIPTQTIQPIALTSDKPIVSSSRKQSVNKSKGVSGKSNMPPKESHIPVSNQFSRLEDMDTQEVHTPPSKTRPQGLTNHAPSANERSRSRSPNIAPK